MPEKTTDSTYKQDIDYIFHVEHQLPMEWYTQLEATKADLVKCITLHVEAAVKAAETTLRYRIAANLKEHIGEIAMKDHYDW